MAQRIKPKIEIYLDCATGEDGKNRAVYRLNGDVYDNVKEVKNKIGNNRNIEIIWKGVFSFPEYLARQEAESKLLKILDGLNGDGKNGRKNSRQNTR